MRLAAAAFVLAASAVPAAASGGFWCDIDDAAARFHSDAGLGRGGLNPMFNFRADLDIRGKLAGAVPALHFTDADISQRWLDADELRLELYRDLDATAYGSLGLLIKTTAVDESTYAGTYVISLWTRDGEKTALAGRATCGAD